MPPLGSDSSDIESWGAFGQYDDFENDSSLSESDSAGDEQDGVVDRSSPMPDGQRSEPSTTPETPGSVGFDSRSDLVGREPTNADIPQPMSNRRSQTFSIQPGQFMSPKSQYEGHVPPSTPLKEREAVKLLLSNLNSNITNDGEQFTEFELSNFYVYTYGNQVVEHKWEMRGLQNLDTKLANSLYCFDGVLSSTARQFYVQAVPFQICSVGGYGHDQDAVTNIWIQSNLNSKSDVFYKLKQPALEYARFHDGFLWIANLAKYFVDFVESSTATNQNVSINSFRSDFIVWAEKVFGTSGAYRKWYSQYDDRDFRRAIGANIQFLWKEYIGTNPTRFHHTLWSQIKDMTFIPEQPVTDQMTVVTPYVYDCFKHMKFQHYLKKVALLGEAAKYRKAQGENLHLAVDATPDGSTEKLITKHDLTVERLCRHTSENILARKLDRRSISIGDVLGVTKDKQSAWKDEVSKWKAADECWWALVQRIHKQKNGKRTFGVLWLYKPADTTCAKMRYPYHDELFLSDNCNCKVEGVGSEIMEEEIICRATVTWYGLPGGTTDFFIRQTYLHDNSFVTLEEQHKQCLHLRNDLQSPFLNAVDKYKIGQTVLVEPPLSLQSRHELEPAVIFGFSPCDKGSSNGKLSMRRLLRRCDLDQAPGTMPNEVVLTDQIFIIEPQQILGDCLVRFYSEDDVPMRKIPAPYSRGGTGNAFYITSYMSSVDASVGDVIELQPITSDQLLSIAQGFDPKAPDDRDRLQGLDLFCGGGNFGRGIEEGGAIRMTHAVDLNRNAVHTHYANQEQPDAIQYFYGSVDDYLLAALEGDRSSRKLVASPGTIEFISAGSPCQGFSLLNSARGNEKGLKNQSLVASVAAFVDFYRPKYALLENVTSMAAKKKGRDEDVMAQLICCFVGMGYQVQLFYMDAWSCGSPQSRSRLFMSIAAPGLKPPQHPALSHSHPEHTMTRGLGRGANGLSFGERKFTSTPFKYVTAMKATSDLPDIGDGWTDQCTRFPDHRGSKLSSRLFKARIESIPRYPRGMTFYESWKKGYLSDAEVRLFPIVSKEGKTRQSASVGSRAWARLHPDKFFPTVATIISPSDGRTGRALHWDQHRLMTVMEARRAQSFPDEEILVGIPAHQWKIIGNSVARTVSLSLGLALREAWLANPIDAKNAVIRAPIENVELQGVSRAQ